MKTVVAVTIGMMLALTSLAFAESKPVSLLAEELTRQYAEAPAPSQWGENVSGVITRLDSNEKLLSLTLDACGSPKGKGVDLKLLDFLTEHKIKATLFVNGRWVDANLELFKQLAGNPLFEIANHGMMHKPASVNGRSAYGISGTRDIAALVEEIERNARKIEQIAGKRPVFYRSGTAYYDEQAVQISEQLGHRVIGFSVLGDAGATYSVGKVRTALLSARQGDIIIAHFNHPEAGTGQGIMEAVPELLRRGYRFVHLEEVGLKQLP
jgi:peptidoglycan/xylan/chitin deacetylase (PgdA/CDA1 family)